MEQDVLTLKVHMPSLAVQVEDCKLNKSELQDLRYGLVMFVENLNDILKIIGEDNVVSFEDMGEVK